MASRYDLSPWLLLLCFVLSFPAVACNGGIDIGFVACPDGTEGCPCNRLGNCEKGLECVGEQCVRTFDSGILDGDEKDENEDDDFSDGEEPSDGDTALDDDDDDNDDDDDLSDGDESSDGDTWLTCSEYFPACPSNYTCDFERGICVGQDCTRSADCPLGFMCDPNLRICMERHCLRDGDCPTSYHCDLEVGYCLQNNCIQEPGRCGDCELCETDTGACVFDFDSITCFPDADMDEPCETIGGNSPALSTITQSIRLNTPLGGRAIETVWICNAGGENTSLVLLSLQLPNTSQELSLRHAQLPIRIPSGRKIPIYAIYQPTDATTDRGTLRIQSNDPALPILDIPLSGSLHHQAQVEVYPHVLNVYEEAWTTVSLRNVGNDDTTLLFPQISGSASGNFTVGECSIDGGYPFTDEQYFPAWQSATCRLHYDGGAMAIGEEARLVFRWLLNGSWMESPVFLRPQGVPICAVAHAGLDFTIAPNTVVKLNGSASLDPDAPDLQVAGYKWKVIRQPPGLETVLLQTSTGLNIDPDEWVDESRPWLSPTQAGDYEIELTVRDTTEGCSGVNSDRLLVRVVPQDTIHIELTWDNSSSNQDLHLVRPGGTYTRSGGSNGTDCHFVNCNTRNGISRPCPDRGCPGPSGAPDWGIQGERADDPMLSIDSSGHDPESIRLSGPEEGDYLVGVEYYSGSSDLTVVVRIWLFGVLMGTIPLYWSEQACGGHCANRHWDVATLRVADPMSITIVPIGQIVPSY